MCHFTKLVLRDSKYLNVYGKTLKALGDDIEEYHYDSKFGNVLKEAQKIKIPKKNTDV